jgi:transcriptional regulator with XRE-family HTH domain
MQDGTGSASRESTLGDRIERLFQACRPAHAPERAWRNNEVVSACRADGREFSESHLSELRRGVKRNPTVRTLEALAWFFEVRVAYFTDPAVAAEVERELAAREAAVLASLAATREAQADERAAAIELQKAIRESGVTRMAHRAAGAGTESGERAAMMRALARALSDDTDDDGDPSGL